MIKRLKRFFQIKYCVLCGGHDLKASYQYKNAILCKDCMNQIPVTQIGEVFAGNDVLDYILSATLYTESVRKLIHTYKFSGMYAVGEILAQIMCDFVSVYEQLCTFDFIIPIPLSNKRKRERGFNQSELLAKRVSERIGIPCCSNVLRKTKNTEKQSRLDAAKRRTNLLDAFACDGKCVQGKSIILVDDIYTTGATLYTAGNVLKKAGADKIIGLTMAIVIQKERGLLH